MTPRETSTNGHRRAPLFRVTTAALLAAMGFATAGCGPETASAHRAAQHASTPGANPSTPWVPVQTSRPETVAASGSSSGIHQDLRTPAGARGFQPYNRWHGHLTGRNVDVYAGASGPDANTGTVLVRWERADRSTPSGETLRLPGSGPVMITASHRNRLTLWDSRGYAHGLTLAWPHAALTGRLGGRVAVPADQTLPTAGICAPGNRRVITVAIGPDTAAPRCVSVFPAGQPLRVTNATNTFGQPGQPITVGFATFPPVTLQRGETRELRDPFIRLAPGVHTLTMLRHPGSSAEIWLR